MFNIGLFFFQEQWMFLLMEQAKVHLVTGCENKTYLLMPQWRSSTIRYVGDISTWLISWPSFANTSRRKEAQKRKKKKKAEEKVIKKQKKRERQRERSVQLVLLPWWNNHLLPNRPIAPNSPDWLLLHCSGKLLMALHFLLLSARAAGIH